MGTNGVFEDVEVLFLSWYAGCGRILFHRDQERASVNRETSVGDEQKRDIVISCAQVGPQNLHGICRHRVDSGERTLQPVDGDASLLEIHIGLLKHPYFRRSEAVTIGDLEDGKVSLRLNDREELANLILGEEFRQPIT